MGGGSGASGWAPIFQGYAGEDEQAPNRLTQARLAVREHSVSVFGEPARVQSPVTEPAVAARLGRALNLNPHGRGHLLRTAPQPLVDLVRARIEIEEVPRTRSLA